MHPGIDSIRRIKAASCCSLPSSPNVPTALTDLPRVLAAAPKVNLLLRGTFARSFRAPSAAENGINSVAAFGGAVVNDRVRTAAGVPNQDAVAPTFVHTPGTREALSDSEFRADVEERIAALHRIGDPVEVAGAVVYLASPAASLVTGHVLVVDGGWTVR